jgi:DNA mismatch repair protein MutS2
MGRRRTGSSGRSSASERRHGRMSAHALEVLEFERVLERVARRASSEPGRRRVLDLRPRKSPDDIARELARVAAVMRFLEVRPRWALGPVPDARGDLAQLAVEGSVLEAHQIARLGVLLVTSRALAAELGALEPRAPELAPIAARLVELEPLEQAITRSVDAEGNVLSTASRELNRIRDRLRGAHGRIVRALEAYLGSLAERYVVPDASVSIRDGRYVVPIRREGKGEVGGIVHGESQTGATLYVEPPVAIELMNALRDLEGEEAREILRILRELTARLAPYAGRIAEALDALADFDALEARARAARAWNGHVPELAPPGVRGLTIRQGRHPLLLEMAESAVVPFDLDLGADERALVVSGPNTGGKSVFLKATGLVAALTQSGVIPPVGPGTQLPVFGSFFADIGDEQSIARNLSTFSAHLANLSDIVRQADTDSLVLIDEMGTGTDPAEGAALARAVLEELVARGATSLVTSHLGELKRLDTEGSGIVNASLQFDAERMEPTYLLVKGRPGRSFGLAIARRLGFPGHVVDRAEAHREQDEARMDELLARLEREEQQARDLGRRLELERTETARLRVDLEVRERAIREAERTSEGRAREDARQMLLAARSEVDAAIRELRGAVAQGQAIEDAAREARRKVERAAVQQRERAVVARAAGALGDRRGEIVPGALVRIASTGSRAKVLEVRADRAWVEAGALKLEVAVAELELLGVSDAAQSGSANAAGSAAPARRSRGTWTTPSVDRALVEIDLRGMRVDEMEGELAKALDEALLGDLGELRIIHGKGTGALRQRVGELLEQDGRVSDFRIGAPQEGGAGVTIARFRR